MTRKPTHPVDIFVGQKIRETRLLRGLTQSDVAQKLGLSFQQLQKYETGYNRVSASKMFDIAKLLDVTPAYFFEGYDSTSAKTKTLLDDRTARAAHALAEITDDKIRGQLQAMIHELANQEAVG